jgi:hypothetical protein
MAGGPSDATEKFWKRLGATMIVSTGNTTDADACSEGREVEFCTIAG